MCQHSQSIRLRLRPKGIMYLKYQRVRMLTLIIILMIWRIFLCCCQWIEFVSSYLENEARKLTKKHKRRMSIDFKTDRILHNFIAVYEFSAYFTLSTAAWLRFFFFCHCIANSVELKLVKKKCTQIVYVLKRKSYLKCTQVISDCNWCFRNISSIRLYRKRFINNDNNSITNKQKKNQKLKIKSNFASRCNI